MKTPNRNMLLHLLLAGISISVLVQAQDQSGFISLDCGLPANTSYTEASTELFFISDANYTDSGESRQVTDTFKAIYRQHNWYLRSFSQGIRNCHTIKVVKGTNYVIRANFLYGNYDGLSKLPTFDLYFGVNFWDSVEFSYVSSSYNYYELIHVSTTSQIQICLVNTGFGTPFISAIELRPLPNDTYQTDSGSLSLYTRWDIGSVTNLSYRFNYDVYDRIWGRYTSSQWTPISTSLIIDADSHNDYQLPTGVTRSAATPINASASMDFSLSPANSNTELYVYMHFAEVIKLLPNQTRSFNITFNDEHWFGPFAPTYLYTSTVYSPSPLSGQKFRFSLVQTEDSDLPPILNAVEFFTSISTSEPETYKNDADAMMNIKSTYKLKKNWQGDPCAPKDYTWDGLDCSRDQLPFRITSLNLSSSGLAGFITPYLSYLQMLESLDLSNNNLTGSVPDFLTGLQYLKFLILDNNELNGSIPNELVRRFKSGSLSISAGGNPNMEQCQIIACPPKDKDVGVGVGVGVVVDMKKISLALILGIICGALFLMLLIGFCAFCIRHKIKKKNMNQEHEREVVSIPSVVETSTVSTEASSLNSSLENARGRQFSYAEVVRMTNNFEREIGRGGFGVVFHGCTGDIPVAVKVTSESSARGYQQFLTEATLLMRVHHVNLTSLVGYMKEGPNFALVYEFMANKDLAFYLLENTPKILTWEERLRIATDAAYGLEYLHNSCIPPIIHRDVKTTNILLSERFQAKLSDFGLSKNDVPSDGGTRLATSVVPTSPSYLDPEYSRTGRLTKESDVYSFGVVLLEIISCRHLKSTTTDMIQWVRREFSRGDMRSIIDQRISGNYDINSAWKAVELTVNCVSVHPNRRPSMSEVLNELKGCLKMEVDRRNEGHDLYSVPDSIEMVSANMAANPRPMPR